MRQLPCFVCSLSFLIFGGCATTPPPPLSAQAVAKIDYGAFPTNYEQIIKNHFAKTLPESAAQFRFGKPFAGYIQQGPLLGGKVEIAGYFAELWVAAKGNAGTPLPERHLGVLILNGDVLMELTPSELANVKRAP